MNLNDADSYNNRGVASALGVPCTLPLHCPDCDRIVPVRSHYWAGASKRSICKGDVMLTMLIHTSKFRTMRTRQSVTLPYRALLSNNSTA